MRNWYRLSSKRSYCDLGRSVNIGERSSREEKTYSVEVIGEIVNRSIDDSPLSTSCVCILLDLALLVDDRTFVIILHLG